MDEYIEREDVLNIAAQYCPDDDGSCSKEVLTVKTIKDYYYIIYGTAIKNHMYTMQRLGESSVALKMCTVAEKMLYRGEY